VGSTKFNTFGHAVRDGEPEFKPASTDQFLFADAQICRAKVTVPM